MKQIRLVVLEILRDQVVAEHHDELFACWMKTLQKLKLYFYWNHVSPVQCNSVNSQKKRQNPALQSSPVGERFNKNCSYFLTKWPEVYAVADRTTATIAKCLADLIYRHGVSTSFIHNHALEFLANVLAVFARYSFYSGYQKLPTTPGHPQCDGLIECFNSTLEAKVINNKGQDWDILLGLLFLAYQTMVHFTTGEIPIFLLYVRCQLTLNT